MDKSYVSEFANFMNRYLKNHPEEVEEQMRGYNFFWHTEIDPETSNMANEDIVPDDHYGFSSLFEQPGHKADRLHG